MTEQDLTPAKFEVPSTEEVKRTVQGIREYTDEIATESGISIAFAKDGYIEKARGIVQDIMDFAPTPVSNTEECIQGWLQEAYGAAETDVQKNALTLFHNTLVYHNISLNGSALLQEVLDGKTTDEKRIRDQLSIIMSQAIALDMQERERVEPLLKKADEELQKIKDAWETNGYHTCNWNISNISMVQSIAPTKHTPENVKINGTTPVSLGHPQLHEETVHIAINTRSYSIPMSEESLSRYSKKLASDLAHEFLHEMNRTEAEPQTMAETMVKEMITDRAVLDTFKLAAGKDLSTPPQPDWRKITGYIQLMKMSFILDNVGATEGIDYIQFGQTQDHEAFSRKVSENIKQADPKLREKLLMELERQLIISPESFEELRIGGNLDFNTIAKASSDFRERLGEFYHAVPGALIMQMHATYEDLTGIQLNIREFVAEVIGSEETTEDEDKRAMRKKLLEKVSPPQKEARVDT